MTSNSTTQYLIIDDNHIDQLVTKKLLSVKLNATQIQVVNNGKEGIQWLKANEHSNLPMIILLDIKMPEMNGFEFMETFIKLDDKVKKRAKIFMLSSTLDPEDIARATNFEHVNSLLEKPLSIDALKRLIN
jgi:CheY-like chemotaxis protein